MFTTFLKRIRGTCSLLNLIAGISLVFLMLLTMADVILRAFKRPIPGTYELVGLAGAVAIGFSMPITSWFRGHIYVDFFTSRFPRRVRNGFNIVTRLLAIGLFLLVGWNLFRFGLDLKNAGEVTLTLQLPFYPVVYGVGIAFFVQCLVLIGDLVKIFRGEYE